MWPSPNGTIRNILNGTVFREPIRFQSIPTLVKNWQKPIIIGRHAFGDQYKATDMVLNEPGTLKLVFQPENDQNPPIELEVFKYNSPGVAMSMYNIKSSITDFARASMNYALDKKMPLYFRYLYQTSFRQFINEYAFYILAHANMLLHGLI